MPLLRGVLASLAFVSLGLPDGLLGVAWPSIRRAFGLELDAVGALLVATTLGYVSSSFSSGRISGILNVGTLVGASCALTGLALLGYATVTSWPVLVGLGVCLGLGAGAVDAVLNTYAATRHGHGMLNWLHACYGIGAAAGPLLMTAILTRSLPWHRGYVLVAVGQLVLALAFIGAAGLWTSTRGSSAEPRAAAPIASTLRARSAQLGILVFLLYAGVEASMGLWTYTLLVEARGIPAGTAAVIVSLFWGGLTGGRLLAAVVAGRLPARRLLPLCLGLVVSGTLLLLVGGSTVVCAGGVTLTGIACGPVFPTLIATTPARVGSAHAANAVGFQVAAAGMAFLPAMIGTLAAATTVGVIAATFVMLAVALFAAYGWLQSGPAGPA